MYVEFIPYVHCYTNTYVLLVHKKCYHVSKFGTMFLKFCKHVFKHLLPFFENFKTLFEISRSLFPTLKFPITTAGYKQSPKKRDAHGDTATPAPLLTSTSITSPPDNSTASKRPGTSRLIPFINLEAPPAPLTPAIRKIYG